MKDLTFTSPPEFRTVSEFAFQNPQGETETNAYYETVDHALREIDDLAFAFPAGLAIPNPYGLDFSSEFLAILVENLHQHEMPPGGALYYRSYIASEPVLGLRVEFWGAGMHPLPPALTTKEWFTAQDRPWEGDVAPKGARQQGGVHAALSEIFESLACCELAEVVYLGWREDNRQEGPGPHGHIIAIHFAVVGS